jgi:hypothetical protein
MKQKTQSWTFRELDGGEKANGEKSGRKVNGEIADGEI